MRPITEPLTPLDSNGRAALARWMGDSPFSALSAGQVRGGHCEAYAAGDPGAPAIAVVRSAAEPTEPAAFGRDVDSLWSLLARVPGWYCVNVAVDLAPAVARLFSRRLQQPAQILSERYYVLDREVERLPGPGVRRLGPEDSELVHRSEPIFRSFFLGHGSPERTLSEGTAAGIVVDDALLSAVTTSAWAGLHVDLGAVTVPNRRGQGFATACATEVCAALRARGLRPVWAAGERNIASWRVPEKLGFEFVGRREYVVFEGLRSEGYRPAQGASGPA